MTAFGGFPPETIRFLRELRVNNRKDWFDVHRSDYEAFWVAPAKAFVVARDPGHLYAALERLGSSSPVAHSPRAGRLNALACTARAGRLAERDTPAGSEATLPSHRRCEWAVHRPVHSPGPHPRAAAIRTAPTRRAAGTMRHNGSRHADRSAVGTQGAVS